MSSHGACAPFIANHAADANRGDAKRRAPPGQLDGVVVLSSFAGGGGGARRTRKRQKEADFGLFGEDDKQGDLYSRGAQRPLFPRQAATRTPYQLAQGARDFMPMKRLLEGAGLRLRVIDANRLGITLDDTTGRRVPGVGAAPGIALMATQPSRILQQIQRGADWRGGHPRSHGMI